MLKCFGSARVTELLDVGIPKGALLRKLKTNCKGFSVGRIELRARRDPVQVVTQLVKKGSQQ